MDQEFLMTLAHAAATGSWPAAVCIVAVFAAIFGVAFSFFRLLATLNG